MTFTEGAQYRVTVPRASLERMKPIGPWAWAPEIRRLPVGSVITFDGARAGVGSDPITEAHWVAPDGSRGWTFSPDRWGWPKDGALAPVAEGSPP